ncbi:NAD(P)/FAD-dependent oxidoreductase [Spongiibacter sp.]|uniref:NAD(P)/FAD-dependent oxidoreductase n=1 Tax=Spongiibacter sp. TaxID=2024860 RepID=UPI003565026F
MSSEHCVIIGASHAGVQLATSLRREGWPHLISLVDSNRSLPFQRPPLSKGFMQADTASPPLNLRPEQFYRENSIALLNHCTASELDRHAKTVVLNDGQKLRYSKLVLATGTSARQPPIPGRNLPGVFYLRSLGDAQQLKTALANTRTAVVIGGGYIGLETAATLQRLGVAVTVVESASRVLQRVTAPEISTFYARVHHEEGVKLLTGCHVQAIEGDKHVRTVHLSSGQSIPTDMVIIGVGVEPNTGLAEVAGLTVSNGIAVDKYLRSNDPDILAIGDCCNHFNPFYQRRIRLESVQNAVDQAKSAAKTLCGYPSEYRAMPWFWSDQYDIKLQIAGLSSGYDELVTRGSTAAGRSFAVFYYRKGRLIAVDAINRPKEFLFAKNLLAAGRNAQPDKLRDETIDLRDITD